MDKTNINALVPSIERSLHLIHKNLFSIKQYRKEGRTVKCAANKDETWLWPWQYHLSDVFLGSCWSIEHCVGFFSGTGEEIMDPHKSVVFGYDGVPAHLDLAIPAQYEHSLCFPLRHHWKGFKLSESDTKVRHLESGFKMVLMTLMLALMKVYFLFCMSNDANQCPKILLNVDLNAKIVLESDLGANVRFFALMNVSSRCWLPFTQMNAYFLVMNSRRCSFGFKLGVFKTYNCEYIGISAVAVTWFWLLGASCINLSVGRTSESLFQKVQIIR